MFRVMQLIHIANGIYADLEVSNHRTLAAADRQARHLRHIDPHGDYSIQDENFKTIIPCYQKVNGRWKVV